MVIPEHLPWTAPVVAAILCALGEALHLRRTRRIAILAFGKSGRPRAFAQLAPFLRVLSVAAMAFGIATLLTLPARSWSRQTGALATSNDPEHIVIVLDVSPSMRLEDAGPKKTLSRMHRAREVLESFFDRVPFEHYRVSVVAVYSGAKPVVVDTSDFEVVRNILGDLPMHYAFNAGKTELLSGLEEAARIAKPWNPGSATLLLVSDGDTIPAAGMPKMPPSVKSVLVIGIGDPTVGKFIDGRHSRQDVATLRQIATRLAGVFHNGNETQIATSLIHDVTRIQDRSVFDRLGLREYALIALVLGAACLSILPWLLRAFGTSHQPGVRRTVSVQNTPETKVLLPSFGIR